MGGDSDDESRQTISAAQLLSMGSCSAEEIEQIRLSVAWGNAFPAGTNGLSAMLEKGVELAAALQRQDTVCALRAGMLWQSCPDDGGVPRAVRASCSRRSDLLYSCDPELTVASSSSWTPSTSEILLGGVLDHLRDGGVATFRIGACAAQIRRIHGEILASNFHRGSSKLPISAMAFLAVVERGLSCSLAVGAKSSSARGGAVAAHILVP